MDNRIFVVGDYSVIEVFSKPYQLYFYVLVDTEDVEMIKETIGSLYIWVGANTNYCYVYTQDKKQQKLHRLIMNTPRELQVDHINHNGLDNRKKNLRNCTPKENRRNRRKGLVSNEIYFEKLKHLYA